MNHHLAILSKGWIDLILDRKKTIESRFTKNRCAPFGKVNAGDIVYLKESGGSVKGMFRVAKVETFENLTRRQIYKLYYEHHDAIFTSLFKEDGGVGFLPMPPAKWLDSKYATLIHITDPLKFEEPYPLPFKKRDQRAWVLLDAPLHVCEICEDNYLLEVFEVPDGELLHNSQHFCPPCYARECVSPDEELANG